MFQAKLADFITIQVKIVLEGGEEGEEGEEERGCQCRVRKQVLKV